MHVGRNPSKHFLGDGVGKQKIKIKTKKPGNNPDNTQMTSMVQMSNSSANTNNPSGLKFWNA